jgi:hypothetical protein
MTLTKINAICFSVLFPVCFVSANTTNPASTEGPVCQNFGPQTPRDIDNLAGVNPRQFSLAPDYQKMNLCNLHFHTNAEHKAKDFSIFAGSGDKGGYQCQISQSLTPAELKEPTQNICKGLKPGATIEVHWVHSSCNTTPGYGLAACSTGNCVNPRLRVETQVFTLVNDSQALNFNDMVLNPSTVNGFYQAKSIPSNTGKSVEFTGSTTGTSFSNQTCSAFEVSWAVRPQCAKLDINSLGQWCKGNVFKEDHAHGVRVLVTDEKLLSEIK